MAAMEERVRELEEQLQSARNDVKRYASFALRVQQELAREQQRAKDRDTAGAERDDLNRVDYSFREYSYIDDDGDEEVEGAERLDESRVGRVAAAHATSDEWMKRITGLKKLIDTRSSGSRLSSSRNGAAVHGPETRLNLDELCEFIRVQKQLITEMDAENDRLRDSLSARPTRRELLGCYLEIERLKSQIHQSRFSKPKDESQTPAPSPLFPLEDPSSTVSRSALASRVLDDKLLRSLYVTVESVTNPRGGSSRGRNRASTDSALLRRSFLKENVICRLSLDQSAIDAAASSIKKSRTDSTNEQEVAKRVGRLCSDIVASCCHVLGVNDIAKLPRYLETLQRLAQIGPVYQSFTEKLEQEIRRFNSNGSGSTSETYRSQDQMLSELMDQIKDILVELDARREQMKPPGSKSHAVLFECMQLLQVNRIDHIASNIRRMIDSIRAEQQFEEQLRSLLGLDETATRKHILSLTSKLFCDLGFESDEANRQQQPRTARTR